MINAIIGHLVADYLLQNDWMAVNKKKSSTICTLHCSIWAISVTTFAQWPIWTLIPLFITHFAQDRTQIITWYMKTIGQKQFSQEPFSPWSIIAVDQVWHLLIIWIINQTINLH